MHDVKADKDGINTGDIKGRATSSFTAPSRPGSYGFLVHVPPGMTGKLEGGRLTWGNTIRARPRYLT